MDEITIENLSSHCRACLGKLKAQKYNIYQLRNLSKLILVCTSLSAEGKNEFPRFICRKCYDKLHEFDEFRIMTKSSTRILSKIVNKDKYKNNSKDSSINTDVSKTLDCTNNIKILTKDTKNIIIETDTINEDHQQRPSQVLKEFYDTSLSWLENNDELELQQHQDYNKSENLETLIEPVDYIACTFNNENLLNTDDKIENHQLSSLYEIVDDNLQTEDHVPYQNINISVENAYESSSSFIDTTSMDEIYNSVECSFPAELELQYQSDSVLPQLTETVDNTSGVPLKAEKTKSIFHCEKCDKRFKKRVNLDAHLRTHLGLKPYQCEQCNRAYKKSYHLRQHITNVHSANEIQIQCPYEGCQKVFRREPSYKAHCRIKHLNQVPPTRIFVCEDCGYTFKNATALKEHRYKHSKQEDYPFKCDQCEKSYTSQRSYKEHLLRHAGIKKFECPYCGMKKTTRNELRTHINYHTKEKQWKCQNCTSVFNSAANLGMHDRIVHKGIRRFACKYCDMSFGKPDTLKHHEMRHTGEKPHACDTCGKRFIQAIALKTHLKTHEKELKRQRRNFKKNYEKATVRLELINS